MVSALPPFINSSLECALLCVSFQALSTLWLACKAVRKFSFANFLSFAFCNAFSLLCFNNFFLSIFIVYIFVVLFFLVFTVLALFLSVLISFLEVFFTLSSSNIIVSSVSLSLVPSLISWPIFVFYWGFSQIYTVWCLVKTIPTVCNTIYLWNKTSVSIYYLIACIFYFLT